MKNDETAEKEEILRGLIKPNYIKHEADAVKVNERLYRVLAAVGWPRAVELGFLNRFLTSKGNFDISLHIRPLPPDSMRYRLGRLLNKQKADLIVSEDKGEEAEGLRVLYEDTKTVLRSVERGEEKVFDVGLYITVKSSKRERLDTLTRKVKADLEGIGIVAKQPSFRMYDGVKSCLPLASDRLKITRALTTSALTECFPFTSPYISIDRSGIILGINQETKIPVIRDIFSLINPHSLVAGLSGSGKSFFTKLTLSRLALKGVRIFIIDPSGEYTGLVKALGGEEIRLSRDSTINPLDMLGYGREEKTLSLLGFFDIALEGLSIEEKTAISKALERVYEDFDSPKRRCPVLGDLHKTLKAQRQERLCTKLSLYTEGVFSFLNRGTSIKPGRQVVSFNIKDLPKQVRPAVMYLVIDYIYSTMKRYPQQKLLVIDEAWTMLSRIANSFESSFLFEIVKTARKHNLSMFFITQELYDLLQSGLGEAILANTSSKYLFRQDPAVVKDVVRKLGLNKHEKGILLSSGRGEGLMIADRDHIPLRIIASPAEYRLITTDPRDIESSKKIYINP